LAKLSKEEKAKIKAGLKKRIDEALTKPGKELSVDDIRELYSKYKSLDKKEKMPSYAPRKKETLEKRVKIDRTGKELKMEIPQETGFVVTYDSIYKRYDVSEKAAKPVIELPLKSNQIFIEANTREEALAKAKEETTPKIPKAESLDRISTEKILAIDERKPESASTIKSRQEALKKLQDSFKITEREKPSVTAGPLTWAGGKLAEVTTVLDKERKPERWTDAEIAELNRKLGVVVPKTPEAPKVPEAPKMPALPKEPRMPSTMPDWAEKTMLEKGELTPEETDRAKREYMRTAEEQSRKLDRIAREGISVIPPRVEMPKPKIAPKKTEPSAMPLVSSTASHVGIPSGIPGVELLFRKKGRGVETEVYRVATKAESPKVEMPKAAPAVETDKEKESKKLRDAILSGKFFEEGKTLSKGRIAASETRFFEKMGVKTPKRVDKIISPGEMETAGTFKIATEVESKKKPEEGYSMRIPKSQVPETQQMPPLGVATTPEEKIIRTTQSASEMLSKQAAQAREKADKALKKDIIKQEKLEQGKKDKAVKAAIKEEITLGKLEAAGLKKTHATMERWEAEKYTRYGVPFYYGKSKQPIGKISPERAEEITKEEYHEPVPEGEPAETAKIKPWYHDWMGERKVKVTEDIKGVKEAWLGKPAKKEYYIEPKTHELKVKEVKGAPGILERYAKATFTPRRLHAIPRIPSMKREKDPRVTEQWQRKKYFG